MKPQDITNIDVMAMIENATELFKLGKYKSKKFVESHIGLAIHHSYFYGIEDAGGNVTPLQTNDLVFESDDDITLYLEGPVVLPKIPVNNGAGSIVYEGYGLLVVDGVVVQDNRGGSGGGGTWGSINGNVADQADLQGLLDDKVAIATNPTKTVKGAIKADYDATTSTLEISIDGTDIL